MAKAELKLKLEELNVKLSHALSCQNGFAVMTISTQIQEVEALLKQNVEVSDD